MLSSRLKAFVIPTSQTIPRTVASTLEPTISTVSPEASTIPAAANCAASLAIGLSVKRSSSQTGGEENSATPEDSAELPAHVCAEDDCRSDACEQTRKDADAAEDGRRALVPPLPRRRRHQPAAEVRAQQPG